MTLYEFKTGKVFTIVALLTDNKNVLTNMEKLF